jgi:pimeloyl-ACP methyl ester carboxylesterase
VGSSHDYGTNPKLYPVWQEYPCTSGVPILVLWGANDPIFVKDGAETFKRDVKVLVVDYVGPGHFALETQVEYIAEQIDTSFCRRG